MLNLPWVSVNFRVTLDSLSCFALDAEYVAINASGFNMGYVAS